MFLCPNPKGIVDILSSFSAMDQNVWVIIGEFDPSEVNTVNSDVLSFSFPVDVCTRMSIRGVYAVYLDVLCCKNVPMKARRSLGTNKCNDMYLSHYTSMATGSLAICMEQTQHSILSCIVYCSTSSCLFSC